MDNCVVVGVDGSAASKFAVDWAVEEARLRGRGLHLLHACGWPVLDLPLRPSGGGMPLTRAADDDLRDLAARLVHDTAEAVRAADPNLDITTEVSPETPAVALLAAARTAETLVVGSRSHGGFTGLLLGSVSAQVAAHATCPVVVTRQAGTFGGPIVVGVEGSHPSNPTLRYAFAQAAWRKAPLLAVHAWQWPVYTGPGDILPLAYESTEAAAEEERVLAEAVAGWREAFPEVVVARRLVFGAAAAALVEASATAQLTVVGARGHGGFAGLMLGSVSQQVLHHAASPVAVVHPH